MNEYTTIRVRRTTAKLIERLSNLMTLRLKSERGIDANVSKDAAIEVAAASYISSDTSPTTEGINANADTEKD